MVSQRLNIFDMTIDELASKCVEWGEPAYRAKQIWQWLYTQKATSTDAMANLPAALRDRLAADTIMQSLELVREVRSNDHETTKYLFRLPDGQLIETVLMEYSGIRRTACISTQAGCAMGCVFCATGQMGFARNLSIGEIIEQAMFVARILAADGERLSNVVLMGMGEPFHNYEASLDAIRRLIDPYAFGIGQRHITVSTVGLIPAIHRFTQEGLQVRLAISLHAASDDERTALLPINKRYNIHDLVEAVREYIDVTGRRVTFEWALIQRENDQPEQAHALGKLLSGILCHVNLIPLNPTNEFAGQPSKPDRTNQFVEILAGYGVPATVRVRRGIDINAGCGQLKTQVVLETTTDRP